MLCFSNADITSKLLFLVINGFNKMVVNHLLLKFLGCSAKKDMPGIVDSCSS